jgi:glutaryl-CoA dehydrogenase
MVPGLGSLHYFSGRSGSAFGEERIMSGKASFSWIDPLLLDQQLTEEERMVRDSAEQFAREKLAPRVLEAFRHEKTDPAIFREMGEIGLLGATIPEQYGGSGLNYVCYGLSLARSSASIQVIAP